MLLIPPKDSSGQIQRKFSILRTETVPLAPGLFGLDSGQLPKPLLRSHCLQKASAPWGTLVYTLA